MDCAIRGISNEMEAKSLEEAKEMCAIDITCNKFVFTYINKIVFQKCSNDPDNYVYEENDYPSDLYIKGIQIKKFDQ